MEKKIYRALVVLSTMTVLVTSLILSYFFLDFFKSNFESRDIKYILISIGPIIVSLLIFLFIFLYIISSYFTKKIMEPIKEATDSMEDILNNNTITDLVQYPELRPFIINLNRYKEEAEYYILKLEENDKLRREFTANISHELKTPLTSINGYAELISSGITSKDDSIRFSKIIYEEGNRLLSIIDSIISLSNLDNPNLDLEFQEIDIKSILEDILNRLEPILNEKNIEIITKLEKSLIYGNNRMIYDLILNLISNSIKYNKDNGKIYIDIIDEKNYSNFIIRDTGIGILDEDIDRIFERFYIGDKSRSNIDKSTGLGLSIVKHIVDIHNGSIDIQSEIDVGTEIKIRLKKAPTK